MNWSFYFYRDDYRVPRIALFNYIKRCSGLARLLLVFSTLYGSAAHADSYLIITSKDNLVDSISLKEAKSIFLGIQRVYDTGHGIEIVDHPVSSSIYLKFYRAVASKSVAQIRSRRASLTFAGISLPPEVVENDSEVLHWLQAHPNGISYISESTNHDEMKVLLKVSDMASN